MFQIEILVIMKVWMNRMFILPKRQEAEKEGGLCRRPPFLLYDGIEKSITLQAPTRPKCQ
ncbi:MAG: hypothetical protein A2381_11190 [Bdellovibrionales bacterium RIFOXYB1_FULL_37_110]|nr:MAG: hypothetical protein A2181_01510 [Bdellovibrionales bacterium RIFOXYA1_FULL_38_20]OFZ48605.1 MAG: hypothetical protein A2417_09675 [Bdellovibrionales bacterium RIFOXYC1_FULL_37_79]OFZ58414.1 MAG: hypothetical protein A2381_11190 [Bdellovibrionales bacterium RIFOXYB1_FULL_37_110]OFZ61458.1 MAG: hypothetical protein A2577_00110 [Bdellovibrionales bacterium RIFOXYD1_FULL_36_51]